MKREMASHCNLSLRGALAELESVAVFGEAFDSSVFIIVEFLQVRVLWMFRTMRHVRCSGKRERFEPRKASGSHKPDT